MTTLAVAGFTLECIAAQRKAAIVEDQVLLAEDRRAVLIRVTLDDHSTYGMEIELPRPIPAEEFDPDEWRHFLRWLRHWAGQYQHDIAAAYGVNSARVNDVLKERAHVGSKRAAARKRSA